MTRHEARREALCLAFEYSFKSDESPKEVMELALYSRKIEFDPFCEKLFIGVCENVDKLDGYIKQCSDNWKITRISKVALAALRLCTYEMIFEDDIDVSISINEAVELVREFGDEKSVKYVNGVLGKIADVIAEENGADKAADAPGAGS